jgi:hypothetical protein
LLIPGTDEILGSQEELIFAYEDSENREVLLLDLKIIETEMPENVNDPAVQSNVKTCVKRFVI